MSEFDAENWGMVGLTCVDCDQPFQGGQWVDTGGPRHLTCPQDDADRRGWSNPGHWLGL